MTKNKKKNFISQVRANIEKEKLGYGFIRAIICVFYGFMLVTLCYKIAGVSGDYIHSWTTFILACCMAVVIIHKSFELVPPRVGKKKKQ